MLMFNKQNVVTERTGMTLTVFNIHSAFVLICARDFVQESEQQKQHCTVPFDPASLWQEDDQTRPILVCELGCCILHHALWSEQRVSDMAIS